MPAAADDEEVRLACGGEEHLSRVAVSAPGVDGEPWRRAGNLADRGVERGVSQRDLEPTIRQAVLKELAAMTGRPGTTMAPRRLSPFRRRHDS